MIFTTSANEVSHYIAANQSELFCDSYNFYNMTRTENAYANLVKLYANSIGSKETPFDDTTRFYLKLDLLGNLGNDFIQHKVNLLIQVISQHGHRFTNGNAQENFEIHNLTLLDICAIIDDPAFQSANVLDTYSTWKVGIMN